MVYVTTVDFPYLSRAELLFNTKNSRAYLSDLGTRNACFVNTRYDGKQNKSCGCSGQE